MAESNDYHLLSHIDENYFVPSLIFNVIKEFPLGNLPMCQVAYWFRKTEESIPSLNTYVKKQVKRNFVRYMYKHLGFSS
jgi:hypothetical protein